MFFLLIILFQLIGAFLGMLWTMGSLYTSGEDIPTKWIPLLCPANPDGEIIPCGDDRHFQVFLSQVICTFLFVLEILVIKDRVTAPT